jgi:8-oxo-dGTP diphosphatase
MDHLVTLANNRPTDFHRPPVSVDLVLLTIRRERLHVLLVERDQPPEEGEWGLPGSIVGMAEDLDTAARRVLAHKAALPAGVRLEQLYTFGAVDRHPCMRIISVAYLGLVPTMAAEAVRSEARDWATIRADDDVVRVLEQPDGNAQLDLAFDHNHIIATAVERLHRKLSWTDAAFDLLPPRFTLRELQHVHEVVLGRKLNKPAFRRRMLDTGRLIATGEWEQQTAFRPAELYRVRGKN